MGQELRSQTFVFLSPRHAFPHIYIQGVKRVGPYRPGPARVGSDRRRILGTVLNWAGPRISGHGTYGPLRSVSARFLKFLPVRG